MGSNFIDIQINDLVLNFAYWSTYAILCHCKIDKMYCVIYISLTKLGILLDFLEAEYYDFDQSPKWDW